MKLELETDAEKNIQSVNFQLGFSQEHDGYN